MSRATDNTLTCAGPECNEPVIVGGRGRPRIYCSAACRNRRSHGPVGRVVVEVDHEPRPPNARPTGRIWAVQLRRLDYTVVIATGLGRPSAEDLARQIDRLINPPRRVNRAAMG